MMRKLLFLLLVAALLMPCLSAWRIDLNYKCPNTIPVYQFDPQKSFGTWYPIKRTHFIFESEQNNCEAFNILPKNNHSLVLEILAQNHQNQTVYGILTGHYNSQTDLMQTHSKHFSIDVPLKLLGQEIFTYEVDFTVLDTNYKSYSLLYSCQTFLNIFVEENILLLSKSKSISNLVLTRMELLLNAYKINLDSFSPIQQTC